ncbi:protein phosphatase 1, regulatory subunit 3Da [Corythoichthys intestinalis]|uniref:protein phosphatase 1, regulatory subunit 3Da n=1 Tax=Corythoichthys intestinalis TaxID=161448 RepID=UPI0025A5E1E9|nr:protein phosphatase 1, regulatory subunit 3Da [Corythoichthys intestinalis]XP_057684601.1 protein phosphatase 1, regulatory subunit 3Da [Corythoichthys intestinalis]XP_057684609.1 protein phosphatase 1, regulatory subunit 3Da [Corythoichthys intestinalis]XP_061803609.1 protein phosphatase 1 regulatory subunit 3D-like [Nerophis lumbriciformis]
MDRGWFIGQEKVLPTTSEQDKPLTDACTLFSKPYLAINLNDMLRHIKSDVEKKPIPIRPPCPRLSTPSALNGHTPLCEPIPKSIIRQRSRSLPPTTEKRRKCRHIGVRFIDSLGLDLEDIKFFKAGDEPSVPHHVRFKLLMGAELAGGNHLEISLPYLKPLFDQQTSDQPGFLHRLCKHKVCLERVRVFEFCVIGIAQVLNLDFEKDVTARYSFTEWKSCAETKASWVSTNTKIYEGDGQLTCDMFRFYLPVPPFLQPGAVLEFAIKYKVCGTEYWDNNDGQNYKLVCYSYTHTVPKECEDSMVHFF